MRERPPFSDRELAEIRRTRRHPRPTQFDYLHLRRLVDDLAAELLLVEPPVVEVLDVYCGSRPYEDLLPAGARCTGLDVDDRYPADLVTDQFLPFPDGRFDLVLCFEAFHYVSDPRAGVTEIRRILRPGGTVIVTVPLVWEYDRRALEHRFTGPELGALFAGWDDVRIVENGGRAVSWATLTGSMLNLLERGLVRRPLARALLHPLFVASYLGVNGVAALADRIERRYDRRDFALPMNLLVSARRPAGG